MDDKPFDLAAVTGRKGWIVLKSTEVRGDGAQAPGAVTLCYTGSEDRPFAVHFFNAQDGGLHSGDYYAADEREDAEARYAHQAARFTRHHARLDAETEQASTGPRI